MMAEELNGAAKSDDPAEVVKVRIPWDHIFIHADDWKRATALTDTWHVVVPYDRSYVVATDDAARQHHQWNSEKGWLLLADFLADPPDGHNVRYLDGDTLILTRDNLIVLKKRAKLVKRPIPPRVWQMEEEARIFAGVSGFEETAKTLLAEAAELRAQGFR